MTTQNTCQHCGKEYNYLLPKGLCTGCLNYEHHNKNYKNDFEKSIKNTSPEKKCEKCHVQNCPRDERCTAPIKEYCNNLIHHDQVQWKKEFEDKFYMTLVDEYWLDNGYYGPPDKELGDKIQSFFLQTLQHLHGEIMESKSNWGNGKELIDPEDLQAIFTRYGVRDKNI